MKTLQFFSLIVLSLTLLSCGETGNSSDFPLETLPRGELTRELAQQYSYILSGQSSDDELGVFSFHSQLPEQQEEGAGFENFIGRMNCDNSDLIEKMKIDKDSDGISHNWGGRIHCSSGGLSFNPNADSKFIMSGQIVDDDDNDWKSSYQINGDVEFWRKGAVSYKISSEVKVRRNKENNYFVKHYKSVEVGYDDVKKIHVEATVETQEEKLYQGDKLTLQRKGLVKKLRGVIELSNNGDPIVLSFTGQDLSYDGSGQKGALTFLDGQKNIIKIILSKSDQGYTRHDILYNGKSLN